MHSDIQTVEIFYFFWSVLRAWPRKLHFHAWYVPSCCLLWAGRQKSYLLAVGTICFSTLLCNFCRATVHPALPCRVIIHQTAKHNHQRIFRRGRTSLRASWVFGCISSPDISFFSSPNVVRLYWFLACTEHLGHVVLFVLFFLWTACALSLVSNRGELHWVSRWWKYPFRHTRTHYFSLPPPQDTHSLERVVTHNNIIFTKVARVIMGHKEPVWLLFCRDLVHLDPENSWNIYWG